MCPKIIIQNVKWEKLRTSLVRFIIYSRDNDAIWWFQNNGGENSWELLVLLEENEASAFDTLKMKTQEKDFSLAVSRFWCLSCIPECICLWSAANCLSFSFRLAHFLLPQLLISHVSNAGCGKAPQKALLHVALDVCVNTERALLIVKTRRKKKQESTTPNLTLVYW